jgi:Domain of unknown function (DUF4129)
VRYAPGTVGRLRHSLDERRPGAPRRGAARRRSLWPALAAVALLALVSVGSLRERPGVSGGTARFPSVVVDTLTLLVYLAAAGGLLLAAWTLLPSRASVARRRRRRNPVVGPLVLLLSVLVLALLRSAGWLDGLRLPLQRAHDSLTSQPALSTTPPRPLPGGGPRWISFAVVGALLLGLALAIVVRSELARRRRAALTLPGELAGLLDEALDDLEHETDPRRAVIAAWVRMERGLAAAGLPRRAAEAPFEYVARVLERASVEPAPVRRLADLFEEAKFSEHAIDERMRRAAVEAVTQIRQQLEAERARLEEAARSPEAVP